MKLRGILMVLFLSFVLSITAQVKEATAAQEQEYQQWEPEMGVSPSKVWTVAFNSELDKKYVTNDYIYVTNSENKRLSNAVVLNHDGKSVSVQPPKNGYVQGETYHLHLSKSLSNKGGGSLQKAVQMPFIIEREEVDQYTLEKNVIEIQEVTNVVENQVILPVESEQGNIHAGDIIILPPDDKNPQGIAKKVERMETVDGEIHITTSQPHFTEVFEEIDLYKKIKITADDIDPESLPAGVTVRSVPTSELESSFNASAAEPSYDATEVLEYTFDNFAVENVLIDGTIRFFTPELIVDIKRKGTNITRANIDLNTVISKNITVKKRIKGHPKDNKNKDVEIPLLPAPITIPVGGPFAVELGAAVVADTDFSGDINITFENRLEINTGIRKTGNPDKFLGLEAYFKRENDPNLTFNGTGTAKLEAGLMFSIGITGAKIVGIDIETSGGGFVSGEGIVSGDPDGDPKVSACIRAMAGAYVDSVAVLEIIEKDIGSVTLADYRFPFDKTNLNTCQSLKKLQITPANFVLEAGAQKQLEAEIEIYDLMDSNSMYFDIDLAKMDPKKEGITFTSSDESKVKVTKKGKVYAPADAVPGEATITAKYYRYLDKFVFEDFDFVKEKKEITQDITITVEPNDLGKIKKLTGTIGMDIENFLHNSVEYTNDGYGYIKADFSTLKGELGNIATEEFMSGPIKSYYEKSMCMDCDSIWFPWSVATDVWFKVLESSSDRMVIETAELTDDMTAGSFIIYTFEKVKDQWLLDDYDWRSFGQKGMNLSIQQSKDYLQNYYLNSEYRDYKTVEVHHISSGSERMYSVYDGKYYEQPYFIFVIETDIEGFTVKFFPHDGYISFDFTDFDDLSLPVREEVNFTELLPNGMILVEKDGQEWKVRLNNIRITSQSELQQLLAQAKKIELEYDVMNKDSKGNVLAYVYADDTLINEWAVQQGHAHLYNIHENTRYLEQLVKAQGEAKEARKGLWKNGDFSIR